MGFLRLLILVLVAGLLVGCGASSDIDGTFGAPKLAGGPVVPAASLSAVKTEAGTATSSSAAARKSAELMAAVSKPGNVAYKIGPQDVLEVSVFKVPDLSKTVQVSEAGTINYPLLGEVEAAGRTARDVEQVLTQELGAKYLQKPQVTVFVKQYNSQRVTLDGAVKKPGVYPISGGMSLLQALAVAQGLSSSSDSTVLIFRDEKGKRAAARFDVAQIRSGSAEDPQLKAGDVIVAGKSAFKEGWNSVLKALPLASMFLLL